MEVSLGLHAQSMIDQNGIEYDIYPSKGTAAVVGADHSILKSVEELVIDSVAYNGKNYPVTEMGQNAFSDMWLDYDTILCPNLKTLRMPNLKTMGEDCFEAGSFILDSLETVDFPSLQEMGPGCFRMTDSFYECCRRHSAHTIAVAMATLRLSAPSLLLL